MMGEPGVQPTSIKWIMINTVDNDTNDDECLFNDGSFWSMMANLTLKRVAKKGNAQK